jgi:dTDP-4-dehydrorhamnose 3,5-epimerase
MEQVTAPRKVRCLTDAACEPSVLPDGVALHPLIVHADDRGRIGEIFRQEWATGIAPVQWVMAVSAAGVMRGVHAHIRHDDYLVLLHGHIALGLHDLRPGSPTQGRALVHDLNAEQPTAVVIPHGVAHGLLFLAPSTFVLGSSHYYDTVDELGCHWRDPDLGLDWPVSQARLSARDAALPPLRELAARIPRWRAD